MLRQLLMVGAIILYTGCSSKNENAMEKSFKEVIDLGTQMQKTEKVKIVQKGEVKIFLIASYLNGEESAAEEDDKIREKFVISLYQVDDGNITLDSLINADQNITINIPYPESDKRFTRAEKKKRKKGMDKLPVVVKKLSPGDPLLKNIPMINSWSKYYYVEFPPTPKKRFTLTYQNRIYGKIPMPKVSKKSKVKQDKKQNKKSISRVDNNTTVKKKTKLIDKTDSNLSKKIPKQKYYKYRLKFTKKPKYLYSSHKKLF